MHFSYILLFLLGGCYSQFTFSQSARKPNIILLLADDLGYGDLGVYGQQKTETPQLDKMASEGIRFTRFYSASTVCAPARSALLTGLHTGHTPVRGNKAWEPEGQMPLPENTVTFARLLQQNGYTTAAFGKWGLGFNQNSGDPNKQGFDRFYGYNCQSLAHDYFPPYLWDNHTRIDLEANKAKDSAYSAALIQQEALSFIRNAGEQPFFLFLPYTLPHGDVIGPHDSLYRHYAKKFGEPPLTGERLKTRAHNKVAEPLPHAQFAAMVSRLDAYVGEIIRAVKEKGLAENTLIFFTSDNGPHRENGGDPEFFDSNGPYRGIKRDLYEGGIRVPFIAYGPGRIQPAVHEEAAVLWDLFPTILELAGIKTKDKTDGLSLAPVLLNRGKRKTHPYLYWEFHENNGRQAVIWKNWKAVKLNVSTANPAPTELYDLSADPGEKNNLADQFPELVKKMEEKIRKAHVYNPDWPLLYAEQKQ